MNLANEIPFFWHVALTKGFSLDFKWDLDLGYFFLALGFLFFTYLIHCFQFWKIWNTELFVLKSASHERSAFFVCKRFHWLPKDDCIFAVGFPKMTTFWKPNSEYYNKQKMPFIFCHIRFVTAMHELGYWNSFVMTCNALTKSFSLDFKWDLDLRSFFLALSFFFSLILFIAFNFEKYETQSCLY